MRVSVGWLLGLRGAGSKMARGGEPAHDAIVATSKFGTVPASGRRGAGEGGGGLSPLCPPPPLCTRRAEVIWLQSSGVNIILRKMHWVIVLGSGKGLESDR